METALVLSRRGSARRRPAFLLKPLGALFLILLADRLFYLPDEAGATLGVFAIGLLLTLAVLRSELWRRRDAVIAFAAAAYCAFLLIEDPGFLSLSLCWLSLSLAVLLPRAARFGNALQWALRLILHFVTLPIAPAGDARRLIRARRYLGPSPLSAKLPLLILPSLGSLVFLLLFAAANPLIGDALGSLDIFAFVAGISLTRIFLWLFILVLVWALLRPRLRFANAFAASEAAPLVLPGVTTASVTLSLIAFNAIFAVQNMLDLAFLWSGARLPDGMTLAEYAHRGAYPLVATALLAALFVLTTLRPESEMAGSPLIRRLVYLWIGQNIFLVASTMLRTIDYVEAYSLTELRIEALIWMGLVALGLALICIRIWRGKNDTWLVNSNMAAAALVLAVSATADYDQIAADWNVRHAREAGGTGASLDLCYLSQMGSSSLLPLIEFESRRHPPSIRARAASVRTEILDRLEARQASWSGWTWRDARRLESARRLIAERRLPRVHGSLPACEEQALSEAASPPLTAAPAR